MAQALSSRRSPATAQSLVHYEYRLVSPTRNVRVSRTHLYPSVQPLDYGSFIVELKNMKVPR